MRRICNMTTQSLLIKSFVVLDLETTGLPHLENFKTRITELSINAAFRKHLIDASKSPEKLPRVIQKLNVCFYPNKLILPETTNITGLSNDILEEYKSFDESFYNILHSFLERLPQPVCLIAHNGLRFDFPILQSELKRIGKQLPDTIFCADSLHGFRHILRQAVVKDLTPNLSSEDVIDSEIKAVKQIFEAEDPCHDINEDQLLCKNWTSHDDLLLKTLIAFESCDQILDKGERRDCEDYKSQHENKVLQEAENALYGDGIYKDLQKALETTPKTSGEIKYLPEKAIKVTVKNGSRARKRLFKTEQHEGDTTKVLKRFRLCDIYMHLFDRDPIESHRAENDAINLMQCIVAESPRFLEWVDVNAKPLNTVKCLLS